MKKTSIISLAIALQLSTIQSTHAVPIENIPSGFAKNVIIMIPDGMSQGGVTLTRWRYNNGEPLHLDKIATGLVRTHNSDTIVADSAPAGSAMATGHKTQDKLIAIKPAKVTLTGANFADEESPYSPVATVLELAKLQGKSTGIIATSEIMHATPAAFTAHALHRNHYDDISEQQVHQELDVVLGGGRYFLSKAGRKDNQDLLALLAQKNYQVLSSTAELSQLSGGKVWGVFADKDMDYDIDRTEQPSLAEMTQKAIDLLSKNEKGFILMVEGSKVDWAAHDNATATIIGDIKAFDNAVGVALNYAMSNPDTLLIVASDHGNGGITIGNRATSSNYSTLPLEHFVTSLREVKMSEQKLAKQLQNGDNVKGAQQYLSNWISEQASVGWTTGGHTGEDVALYVYTANPLHTLTGVIQNSDIAKYIAKAVDGDLDDATKQLFVPSRDFTQQGVSLKTALSDEKTTKFVLSQNNQDYTFYKNRNYFEHNNQKITFNGVVFFNGKELYIPNSALALLK